MEKSSPSLRILILFLSLFCLTNINGSFAMENSLCMECHGDEDLYRSGEEDINKIYMRMQLFVDEERFNNSVHHTNEITCIDCHSDIEEVDLDEDVPHKVDLAPPTCTSCHEEQGSAFISSSHMKARRKGIVMNCYACHDYHYVKHLESASVAERGKTFCLRCHNPYQSHDWLTQKAAHFDSVECSVCHAPETRRHIHLSFYDLVTNKSLSGDEILRILSITEDEFMTTIDKNNDRSINTDEFDDLVLMLRQKAIRSIVHAELVVEPEPIVHSVTREGSIRECGQCHAPDSPFFSSVTIVLTKNDGMAEHFEVDRAILESYHTSHFSALAGTRIRLLDKIGFLVIAGAALLVSTHLFARLVTVPVRRKRKEQTPEGEKADNPEEGTQV